MTTQPYPGPPKAPGAPTRDEVAAWIREWCAWADGIPEPTAPQPADEAD